MTNRFAPSIFAILSLALVEARAQETWQGYAGNSQHTATSSVQSQALDTIIWQTPVDLQPQYSGSDLFIHYGSPLVTTANTIILPVKTGVDEGFKIEARRGTDGSLLWTQTTNYLLPPHNWTPSFSPTLTPQGRLYWAGAAGVIFYRANLDTPGMVGAKVVNAFAPAKKKKKKKKGPGYANVQFSTPLTSDASGTIFVGYEVNGTAPAELGTTGVVRVDANGRASFMSLRVSSGSSLRVTLNCAPALSLDGSTLYITAHGTSQIRNGQAGYLFALDSRTLQVKNSVALLDPESGDPAQLLDDGTASPTVGPDGHVYIGVFENPFTSDKGWLLQFSADLTQSTGAPGAFGWDDTASVVPATMVPSYTGTSTYLLMTKYNNYAGIGDGGDGKNELAILDPNDSQTDARTGATVMKEILTILGQTPDQEYVDEGFPDAVREWCINTAVVDPATNSILAGSEDGKLYRWDLTTNTFSQVITLTPGIGEAYTPTVIGTDGKVYAINNATLFAVGAGGTTSVSSQK